MNNIKTINDTEDFDTYEKIPIKDLNGVTEVFRLKGTSEDHIVQSLCSKLEQGA